MTTIDETVTQHIESGAPPEVLVAALLAREDTIRENLTMIAAGLGTYPEFVAEAFAEVGLGTPPTPEMREMLRQQFVTRMQWLQEQARNAEGGGV